MENFTPKKLELNDINSGKKFVNGDSPTADAFNKVIEGVLGVGNNAETDKTLTQENVPADAKAVGDRLKEVGSTDVQINGESITENGVANIPIASESEIESRTPNKPIMTNNLDKAIQAGLISNSEITAKDQASICDTIGAVEKKESPNTNFRYVYGKAYATGEEILIPVTDAIPYSKIAMGDNSGRMFCGDPTLDYHCTNKLYVDTKIANAGGGSKLYKHTLTFGGGNALASNCKAIIRNERSTPYTDWQTLMRENIAFPFSSQQVGSSGFIYTNLVDLGTTDDIGDISIFCWTFGENTTSPTDMYHRVGNESLVDEVEEI